MAQQPSNPTPGPADPTFRNYSAAQAASYSTHRHAYPPLLYECLLAHHAATRGRPGRLLDCGCGPGSATRDLAPHFDAATGTDPSAAMIEAAAARGDVTRTGAPVAYAVGDAEALDGAPGVEAGNVDLLVAGMAAHWFDMRGFWAAAARVVAPGGTVALWTVSSLFAGPATPNRGRVQEVLFELERGVLAPFEKPGNRLSREMYVDLGMPWDFGEAAFAKDGFERVEWNRDGAVGEDGVFLMGKWTTLEDLGDSLGTASMVTRWREANPEKVGTDEDCVVVTIRELREALGSGVEGFEIGGAAVLLLFKRS